MQLEPLVFECLELEIGMLHIEGNTMKSYAGLMKSSGVLFEASFSNIFLIFEIQLHGV